MRFLLIVADSAGSQKLVDIDLGSVSPKVLKVIELSGGTVEDVYDNGGVVQRQPVTGIVSLGMERIAAELGKTVADLVTECVYMGGGASLANYEVVGERGLFFYLQKLYSSCLLLVKYSDDSLCKSQTGGNLFFGYGFHYILPFLSMG